MRKDIKLLLIGLCLVLSTVNVFSQEIDVNEDHIPLSIQGYFYSNYKNVKDVQWSQVQNIGEQLLKVRFSTKEDNKIVTYDYRGDVQEEISISKKSNVDYLMSIKAETKYPAAKVISLKKITRFNLQDSKEAKFFFELILKNNGEMVSVFFNDEKQLLSNDNIFNVAIN